MKAKRRLQGGGRRGPEWAPGVRLRPLVAALVLLISCHDVVWAQSRHSTEYNIKAAYLYNFGKFVRWPASVATTSAEPFQLCVLGRNPFGTSLDGTVKGEKIGGRNLAVRYISGVSDANECRILYISESETYRVDSILAELGKKPILTVSDIPDFVDRGGHIEFIPVSEKIRFKVNLESAEKSGLTLSSDLLKVAVSVKRNGRSGE